MSLQALQPPPSHSLTRNRTENLLSAATGSDQLVHISYCRCVLYAWQSRGKRSGVHSIGLLCVRHDLHMWNGIVICQVFYQQVVPLQQYRHFYSLSRMSFIRLEQKQARKTRQVQSYELMKDRFTYLFANHYPLLSILTRPSDKRRVTNDTILWATVLHHTTLHYTSYELHYTVFQLVGKSNPKAQLYRDSYISPGKICMFVCSLKLLRVMLIRTIGDAN